MTNIITLEQAAERWSYNPQYLRDIARTGKIPALKAGRKWLFNIEEVESFFRDNAVKSMQGEGKESEELDY